MRGELYKIAKKARKEFEDWSIDESRLSELYLNYQDITDIDNFLSRAKGLFPRLNCGLTSVYLQEKLGGRIVQGFYAGNRHTFLLVNDVIVDITADQYGGPGVYVGLPREPWTVL